MLCGNGADHKTPTFVRPFNTLRRSVADRWLIQIVRGTTRETPTLRNIVKRLQSRPNWGCSIGAQKWSISTLASNQTAMRQDLFQSKALLECVLLQRDVPGKLSLVLLFLEFHKNLAELSPGFLFWPWALYPLNVPSSPNRIDRRNDFEGEDSRGDKATDHRCGNALNSFGTSSVGSKGRHQAEGDHAHGHQLWPHALNRTISDGFK